MGALIPLLRFSGWWAGMDLVRFFENFCKHASEIGQALLTLINIHIWRCKSSSMSNGPSVFLIVPHKDGSLFHHLDVVPFPSNFGFIYFLWPSLRADEELDGTREVVENLKLVLWHFPVSSSRSREIIPILHGLMSHPMLLTSVSFLGSRGLYSMYSSN